MTATTWEWDIRIGATANILAIVVMVILAVL